jgi:hypothetical protein
LLVIGTVGFSQEQEEESQANSVTERMLEAVIKKTTSLDDKLNKNLERSLKKLKKQEEKIQRKLALTDSLKAKQVFAEAKEKYAALDQKLNSTESFSGYIPYLDTLKTSLKFLEQNQQLLENAKEAGGQLSSTLSKVKELESSLGKAEALKEFIKERRTYLKEQLKDLPFAKELTKLNKQAYYYSAQLQEYKDLVKDKKKLERKAVEMLVKSKPFREFMQKNSQLASLFRLPGADDGTGGSSLQGLQTRASVNALLQQRLSTGADAVAQLRDNVQAAQGQLSELKQRAAQYTNGSFGSGDDFDLPQNFKPNSQKTKSFFERIELGSNIQSQKARYFFPVSSDIALSAGYKLNDKSIVGVGASYKLGWGRSWDHINITHQGIGIRSFIDYKIKGNFYIAGGYEQNYRKLISTIDQLKEYSGWQSSGLIGVNKKYSISKKVKGNVQLLWDFLSYHQVPRTQAVVWRVGYSLK